MMAGMLLAEFVSSPDVTTEALLVSVPSADGVPTTATVAEAPLAIDPRAQLVPCARSVQLPWLGVAESTEADSDRPSEATTSKAVPGPWLITSHVYVTGTPTSVGSGASVWVISRSELAIMIAARASTRP